MIIATDFVFVHVMKTGGTWVREVITRHAPPEWRVDERPSHPSILDAGPLEGKTAFGFVRNPWEWHVSRYFFYSSHFWNHTGGYAQPERKWDDGERWWARNVADRDIRAGITRAVHARPRLQDRWTEQLCDESGALICQVGRLESIRTDLARFLVGCTHVPAAMERAIATTTPRMTSPHGDYRSYYTSDLRELIGTQEAPIVKRFGYAFQ